ncbi:methylated-DNA--[protein]-cysteine S-methyltransferase [Pelagibius litoralis]|uniref:Methylated-DNA--protein-cysteine methyltransferase n=1 Tax=Pelagibius litoralis TaxID=374515 RepID=A0A967EVA3_9PROT|nr:methylated-DNA--[protein]-cysteine S-methyltransferase [Pelagibius litoralis]NIA68192.1 methylated-DNA--[protein]-cysteine S-methyltransferase [Pelagibius litoralis]
MPSKFPTLAYSYHETPVGPLLLAGSAARLCLLSFPSGSRTVTPAVDWRREDSLFGEARAQLDAYFAGALTVFDLPLEFLGTDFQKSVWAALRRIPYGATVTYGDLARRIGRPTASRAVGAANGANPLPIIVPCHRVIGSNKSLTGFGGGVPTKRFLLDHEQGWHAKAPAAHSV